MKNSQMFCVTFFRFSTLTGERHIKAENFKKNWRKIMKNIFAKILITTIVIATLTVLAFAQKSDPKFTSFFTDLKTDCKKQKSMEGGHVSFFCKGPDNYQIHYFDSATTLEFIVETLDRENSFNLASQSLDYPKENSQIEWRLADGKPFAVIMPVYKYQTKDGLIEYPTKIVSEKLIVKGLEGFEQISFEEEGKGANLRARDLADNEYAEAIIPSKRIEIPNSKYTLTLEEVLFKGDEKVKYLLKLKKRHRLIVTIETLTHNGEEGPVMYGIVTAPDGERDGQPGGKVADLVTIDGDYEIMVAQNMAKSKTKNLRIKVTVSLEPVYE